ncbi:MAG: EAL domain-containing protein [Rheinheimera sp.]|nr:EAL domain-containing protein [Rheinheimera sp.]
MLAEVHRCHAELVEQLDYFVSTVSAQLRLLTLNYYGRQLCDIRPEHDLKQDPLFVRDFHDEKTYQWLLDQVLPYLQHQSYWQGPLRFLTRTGKSLASEFKILVHRDGGGHIVSYTAIARLNPGQNNAYLTALNQHIFHHAIEGMMLTDASARILSVNAAFSVITGYQPQEVLGQKTSVLRSAHHDDSFYQQMWQQLHQQGYWQGEVWNRRKDCTVYPQWLKIAKITTADSGLCQYLAVFHDLSATRSRDKKIHELTNLDQLTRLGNRDLLVSRLPLVLAQCRQQRKQLMLCWIDGGQLTEVNQQLGLKYGDRLIQAQAMRLQRCIAAEDTLVRIYADDYILLHQTRSQEPDSSLLNQLMHALQQPLQFDQMTLIPHPRIGVACYPFDGKDEESLLQAAELAMLEAKGKGGTALMFYNPALSADYQRRAVIRQKLVVALQHDNTALQLYFQPQINLISGRIVAAEALLRFQDAELGAVSPADFIPIAEQSALIIELDRWVVRRLCEHIVGWKAECKWVPLLAFNISAKHLAVADFADWLLACLATYGIKPSELEMEITETALIDYEAVVIATLKQLKAAGLNIALDDFGTGYSSLSYLNKLPLDRIKIDRSVITDLPGNSKALCILKSLVLLASQLGLELTVEGVEKQQQHQLLCQLGCAEAQGFLYARPMRASQLLQVLLLPA